MNEINVLLQIIDANPDDKFEIFANNFDLMKDYSITYVDEVNGKNNVKIMLDVLQIDTKYIFSPFYSDKLFTLNAKFVATFSPLTYFFDISLDTNIVSYIANNNGKNLDELPYEIVKKLGTNRRFSSSVNLHQYINENCLFNRSIEPIHEEKIYKFFYYLNRFHYRFDFCAKLKSRRSTRLLLQNQKVMFTDQFSNRIRSQYKAIYVSLLKVILVGDKTTSVKEKIIDVIEFMANQIYTIDLAMLELATVYFVKKQNLAFFGRIQKRRQDIIESAKNMTWDLFHLRQQEWMLGIEPIKGIDVNLPLFCTIDKRLLEIKEITKLKAIATNKRTGSYIPFYQNTAVRDVLSELEMQLFFQSSKHYDRIKNKETVNFELIIKDLENEIMDAFS